MRNDQARLADMIERGLANSTIASDRAYNDVRLEADVARRVQLNSLNSESSSLATCRVASKFNAEVLHSENELDIRINQCWTQGRLKKA